MKYTFIFVIFSLLPSRVAYPQQMPQRSLPQARATQTYEETADGLRLLLQDVLSAAKAGDQARLSAFVKDMEIPDYASWFIKAFGQDQGETRVIPYGATLAQDQREFQDLFLLLAKQDGGFSTRNVIEATDPRSGPESGMINSLQRPIDIFFASWKESSVPQGSPGDPIGYFFFIDGKFRWDSTVRPAAQGGSPQQASAAAIRPPVAAENEGPFHPGVNGVGYPSCKYCPGPRFPTAARREGKEGLVQLEVIIQPDGRPTDIHVLKSPRPDFAERAVEAVGTWVFNPAIGPNGAPVAVVTPVEVKFSLVH
jgi:TonB family protein